MLRESSCLRVPKIQGQKTLALADKLGLRDKQLEIQKDGFFICVPVIRPLTENEVSLLKEEAVEFQLETRVFEEQEQQERTLEDVLANALSPHFLASLPRALDIVGDIAIVEVPTELRPHEKLLGEAILQTHRNIGTVLAKAGAVSGTYRTREFDVIAGEPRTRTIHKEFGCQYYVDVAKAYFSPRLSHEHQRVALLVQKDEVVVDLFAGVGPFSILIAKNVAVKVYAVDINPEAFELLKRNILLNRVQNRVVPILGDARQVVHDKLSGVADRVIMNLPESAIEFVDVACEALKCAGGVVHFYGFLRQPDSIDAMKLRFAEAVEKTGRRVEQLLSARTVRETAPYQQQIVLDAHVV